MAKINWKVRIDSQSEVIGTFKNYKQGLDMALDIVTKRFTNVKPIIKEVLKKKHTKYGKKLIEAFLDLSMLGNDTIPTLFYEYCEKNDVDSVSEDSFMAETSCFNDIYCFVFGDSELYIETNIWTEGEKNYFILVKSQTDQLKVCINRTLSPIANIYLVYQALNQTPQSRAEIRSNIFCEYGIDGYGYDIDISEDTVSNQIHALQKLGIPIYKRSLSVKDRKIKDTLTGIFGDKYKEGFYIDYNNPIAPNYSNCSPRTYFMLVFLTLKEIDKAHALSTQQAIIDAVYTKFGIKLQRQKVKNYIDILGDLGVYIQHDNTGYWMKK